MGFLTQEGDEVSWWWPFIVWPDQTREQVTFEEAVHDVRDWIVPEPSPSPIPIIFGTAAVAAPYVAGVAIVAFAPPWWKPIGASMLVPGPTDPLFFAAGYEFGEHVEDWL